MVKGSLQIKSNKYYAVFRVNGKLKWLNLNIEAKRGNKRKAEEAMAKVLLSYNENPQMFDEIEFVEYIKIWLKETESQMDAITFGGYKQYALKHIIPYFNDKKLCLKDVSVRDIEGYYNYKSKAGRIDGKKGGLSFRSIKLHSVVISLVLKKAIREGLLKSNPCEYARIPNANKAQSSAKFYTVEQCKKLLEITEGSPLYNMIYITTIYGLRRSELLGLKWSAIDFVKNTIIINHTVVLQGKVVAKNKTKNKTSRRIYPLLDDVKAILIAIKENQEKNRKLFGNCYTENDYIFTKVDGTPYYPSYPSKTLHKILKNNNLEMIRWHDLRHTTASMLMLKGWQMKEISEWLGHSDIGTTMNIYAHINMEHKKALGNTLNGLFT